MAISATWGSAPAFPFSKPITDGWTPFYEVVTSRRPRTLRDDLEAEIDRLIDLLNAIDGDPDLEPSIDGTPMMIAGRIEHDLEYCHGEMGV